MTWPTVRTASAPARCPYWSFSNFRRLTSSTSRVSGIRFSRETRVIVVRWPDHQRRYPHRRGLDPNREVIVICREFHSGPAPLGSETGLLRHGCPRHQRVAGTNRAADELGPLAVSEADVHRDRRQPLAV